MKGNMDIINVEPNLYLIPLDQNITGFHHFISSWVYKGDKTFLVDPGPKSTIPLLIKAFESLDIRHLDVILLTHIHIDHAGGTGDLVTRFPDTPVVCHSSGIPHLKSPAKLWEGSLKTLGKTAEAYGPIAAVPEHLLKDAATFSDFGIKPVMTPGHAPHHVSYIFDKTLFVGEAGGIHIPLKNRVYLRPATPPRFFMETGIQSLVTLLNYSYDLICYGHFGYEREPSKFLEYHKDQLCRWREIIARELKHTPDPSEEGNNPDFIEHCIRVLQSEDPLLAGYQDMDNDAREREYGFMKNSVKGFIGYLQEQK